MTSEDAAGRPPGPRAVLGGGAHAQEPDDTADVRNGLHDFAALMRADEQLAIPRGEANLASTSRWRRQLKLRLFRLMRPISWRYDRLLADEAELTTALAERVQQLEAEVARLDGRAWSDGPR